MLSAYGKSTKNVGKEKNVKARFLAENPFVTRHYDSIIPMVITILEQ